MFSTSAFQVFNNPLIKQVVVILIPSYDNSLWECNDIIRANYLLVQLHLPLYKRCSLSQKAI
jgi:hypothetical protein